MQRSTAQHGVRQCRAMQGSAAQGRAGQAVQCSAERSRVERSEGRDKTKARKGQTSQQLSWPPPTCISSIIRAPSTQRGFQGQASEGCCLRQAFRQLLCAARRHQLQRLQALESLWGGAVLCHGAVLQLQGSQAGPPSPPLQALARRRPPPGGSGQTACPALPGPGRRGPRGQLGGQEGEVLQAGKRRECGEERPPGG